MGKPDIIKHSKTQGHLDKAKALESQPSISRFSTSSTSNEILKTTEAEVRMAVLATSSNLPLAFHDQLSPAIRCFFPDSKIATKYHSASTKATCMLNLAIAPELKKSLVENMKAHPFSVCIDGSNDTALEKMYPLAVRIYDTNVGRVVTQFLDMCTLRSATAEAVYQVMDGVLSSLLELANPWSMCTSLGVDNTSVNTGVRNSLKTRIVQRNKAIFFNGCPCHVIHNAAQKSGIAFSTCCGFDAEEFAVDLYYWFDKSTKRKNELRSYNLFCDQEYRGMIKHVSTRWLTLELAVERSLKQYRGLKSYFLSEDESQARFRRLQILFGDPMTEIYLLFLQSVLPVFNYANKFLQREEPLVHALQQQLYSLLKQILGKFIKPSVLVDSIQKESLLDLDFQDLDVHVNDSELVVGFVTKQTLQLLLDEGDISEHQQKVFYQAVREFLMCATKYLLQWCPFKDELLSKVAWVGFENRLKANFSAIEYIVGRYSTIFPSGSIDMNKLSEQFLAYQLLVEEDIPSTVKESAGLSQEDYFRVDILWSYLKSVKKPGSSEYEFDLLFKVAEVIMTIPHSNAGEERIFSLINKNKTPSRSSLNLDGTLSSIITVKTHIDKPLEWKPSRSVLDKAKKATKHYNDTHRKK